MKILIFSLASSLNVITFWDFILAFVQFFSRNTWRIECKLDFECWLGKLVQVRDRSVEMLYGNTPFGPLSPHQPPIHTHCMWSHFHIHSLHSRGNLQMPITYQSTCLWNVGRNQSTRRNPTANFTQIAPGGQDRNPCLWCCEAATLPWVIALTNHRTIYMILY